MNLNELDKQKHFTSELLRWFKKNRRDFPWRDSRVSAYEIALAEALLQKTSVTNALPIYKEVLKKYPNVESLAKSDLNELKDLLRPLGLPRRAILLQQLAKTIAENYQGIFPEDETELVKLPGIGQYGAGAIASQAFGKRATMIDINVMRILHRVFSVKFAPRQKPSKDLRQLVLSLTPKGKEAAFNLALLDFGALVCRAKNPRHDECPMAEFCDFNLSRLNLIEDVQK